LIKYRAIWFAIALYGCCASDKSELPAFRDLGGLNNFAITVSADTKPDQLTNIAREKCAGTTHCSIYAWTNTNETARGMPLTEPELASLAYKYAVNRTTGFQSSHWDCQRFPRQNPSECL
jgi:hypothetical protein